MQGGIIRFSAPFSFGNHYYVSGDHTYEWVNEPGPGQTIESGWIRVKPWVNLPGEVAYMTGKSFNELSVHPNCVGLFASSCVNKRSTP